MTELVLNMWHNMQMSPVNGLKCGSGEQRRRWCSQVDCSWLGPNLMGCRPHGTAQGVGKAPPRVGLWWARPCNTKGPSCVTILGFLLSAFIWPTFHLASLLAAQQPWSDLKIKFSWILKYISFLKFWRSYLGQNLLRVTNPVSDLTGDQ